MKIFFSLLLMLPSLIAIGQDPWKNVYTESAWVERDKWQKPDELISHLNLKSGSRVADIGCHEGYMTFKLAQVVGTRGKVYAVDNRMSVVALLESKLKSRGVKNVKAICASANQAKLPIDSLDSVIILDTYHELTEHSELLKHIRLALKKGGRLVLCEPISDERRKFARAEQEKKHELGINFAIEDIQKAGFTIVKRQDPFIDRSKEKGDKMWLIVAKR